MTKEARQRLVDLTQVADMAPNVMTLRGDVKLLLADVRRMDMLEELIPGLRQAIDKGDAIQYLYPRT